MINHEIEQKIRAAFEHGILNATKNLSEMLANPYSFKKPQANVTVIDDSIDLKQLIHHDCDVFSIEINKKDKHIGEAALILYKLEADKILSLVMGEDPSAVTIEERQDVLCEVSNIIVNSCIEKFAPPFELLIYPGVPRPIESINQHLHGVHDELHYMIQSKFNSEDDEINGEVSILLPANIFGKTKKAG